MGEFERVQLAHLKSLIDWDRDYAEQAIKDAFRLCWWLEPLIGKQLREHWRKTTE
jgi:hypothetical protein